MSGSSGAYAPEIIGRVGGITRTVAVALTVEAAAYAAGDVIGGLIALADAVRRRPNSGLIQAVTLTCRGQTAVQFDCIFFNANPTSTTFTENGPIAINNADLDKIIGFAILTSPILGAAAGQTIYQATQLALPFTLTPPETTLYAVLVARGAVTPGSTADLRLVVRVLQD